MAEADKKLSFNGKQEPDIEINKPAERRFWQQREFNFWVYFFLVMGSFYLWQSYEASQQREIPYSEFLRHVEAGEVLEAVVTDQVIRGVLSVPPDSQLKSDSSSDKEPAEPAVPAVPTEKEGSGEPAQYPFLTVPLWDNDLAQNLEAHGVKYVVRQSNTWLSTLLLTWILPLGILFLMWGWMSRRIGGMGRSFLNIGNKVHIHPEDASRTTFDDVAGNEEAKEELKEVIAFLKDPERIQRLGGRMPKGLLLMGPPGTGKTLLARAVAGEAGVPFFNISGSEFIEMFVGVGAARVRELFEQARQKAPCIMFIDELDAIGGARGMGPAMGGHDEREQTLNQLLSEMDGFDPSAGVVVMAATNRPEILDKALMRGGRFDRQIVVDKPDLHAREAILEIHVQGMKLADDVDLMVIAQRTPGFVGADLATIANEAAIHAVRLDREAVTMEDFEAAVDRVVAGPEKKHHSLGQEEKQRIAYHESGHALVALTVPTAQPVHKVSIIPHGVAALGYTLQLPVEEKFLSTASELRDQIAVLLGGRAAENIVYGDVSSGAANDLERATAIARSMVTQLGMSDELGPVTLGIQQQLAYLGVRQEERNYSEATASRIDEEVKTLVEEGQRRASEILTARRDTLEKVAAKLQAQEVMDQEELLVLYGDAPASGKQNA